jgi:hypothetical protein
MREIEPWQRRKPKTEEGKVRNGIRDGRKSAELKMITQFPEDATNIFGEFSLPPKNSRKRFDQD